MADNFEMSKNSNNFNHNNSQSNNLPQLMSVPEMWSLVKGEDHNWGIEGYEAPRKYFDYNKVKYWKEFKENSKKVKWPLKDAEGNVIVTKRPNYLDEVMKWANSYYNKEKAEEIIEKLTAKGQTIEFKPKPQDKKLTKLYKHNRHFYIDDIIRNEKNKLVYYPDKEDDLIALAEKIKEQDKEKKSDIEKLNMKYKTVGSMPKCDRVTVVSEAEYIGETMPFCNLQKFEKGQEPKKKKGELNIYYPNVFNINFTLEKFSLA